MAQRPEVRLRRGPETHGAEPVAAARLHNGGEDADEDEDYEGRDDKNVGGCLGWVRLWGWGCHFWGGVFSGGRWRLSPLDVFWSGLIKMAGGRQKVAARVWK